MMKSYRIPVFTQKKKTTKKEYVPLQHLGSESRQVTHVVMVWAGDLQEWDT